MIRGFNLQSFLSFLLVLVNVVVDLVIVNHCDPICGCLVLLTYANMSWFDEMLLSFLITWQCPCRHDLCSEGSMTIGRTIAMSQRHPKSCFSIGESALRQPYSGTYGWNMVKLRFDNSSRRRFEDEALSRMMSWKCSVESWAAHTDLLFFVVGKRAKSGYTAIAICFCFFGRM